MKDPLDDMMKDMLDDIDNLLSASDDAVEQAEAMLKRGSFLYPSQEVKIGKEFGIVLCLN
jgi:hypothetical protein